jgi:hypothetical protein
MDAIDVGAADVANVVGTQEFVAPPRHVRTVRVQRNYAETYVDATTAIDVPNEVNVYEIWAVVAAGNKEEYFMVVEATCALYGLTVPKWSAAQYKGFYASATEAVNAIGGYEN